MDKSVNVVLGNSLDDTLNTVDVDIGVGEVPDHGQRTSPTFDILLLHSLGGVLTAHKVVDNIGVTDAFFDRLSVAQVVFLWAVRTASSQVKAATGGRHTMKFTRPRSPVTFRWRLAISSR